MADSSKPAKLLPNSRLLLFVVALLVTALSVSLAGRVFQGKLAEATNIQSNDSYGKCQHLDRDAYDWTTGPVQSNSVIFVATPLLLRKTAARPLALHTDDCLYNRPPPTC